MQRWLRLLLSVFFALWLPVSQTLALVPAGASPVPISPLRAVTGSGGPTASTEHPIATNQTGLVISAALARRIDLLTGEQYDPDLGFYYLRARYNNPDSGRFWTMDSYEGTAFDPLSLHKYMYCNANPANGTDPSGHLVEEPLFSANSQMQLRTSQGAGLATAQGNAINSIAASAAITALLLLSTVDVGELQGQPEVMPHIPDQKQAQYKSYQDTTLGFEQYGECVPYAEKISQRRLGGRPLFVAYRLRPQYNLNVYAPWGSILDRLTSRRVADNGFHVGYVIKGLVFDNYYSGIPLMTWPLLYEVIRAPGRSLTATLMRAHIERFGQLKLFKDAPPRSRDDPRWDSSGNDIIDLPTLE